MRGSENGVPRRELFHKEGKLGRESCGLSTNMQRGHHCQTCISEGGFDEKGSAVPRDGEFLLDIKSVLMEIASSLL